DAALLSEIREGGTRLTFAKNPEWAVKAGESLHIRDPHLKVMGPMFTDLEREKIQAVMSSKLFTRWFLSDVEEPADVAQLRELVGPTEEIFLKIESQKGLSFVESHFEKE